MESYLKGVVGYEMSDYFPLEALKAHAVAARNYALFKLAAESAKGYDFDDTVMYQVYKGYDDKLQNIIRAVDETRFIILLHNDKLIEALYSAWHGGYSEDAVNVWGNSVIYLKSKADTFESDSWPNGIIRTKSATRDKTRTFLGLPSNMYNVVYDSETNAYTFNGKGYGHGLGMSQIGAKNRASSGQTYNQILKFYYDGSYLENLTPKASMLTSLNQSDTCSIIGKAIHFNAVAAEDTMYKFEILKEDLILQTTDFSTSDSFIFTPQQSGIYSLKAYSKHPLSTNEYDDSKSVEFTIYDNDVDMTISIDKSKIITGQTINVTADGRGDSGIEYLYKYEVLMGETSVAVKDYSSNNNFSYTPSLSGAYLVNVYMKTVFSLKDFDVLRTVSFEAYAAPQIVSAKSIGKMFINTPINIASDIKPGSNSEYEIRYQLYLNGAILEENALGFSTDFSFTPSKAGKYTIILYVKDNISVKSFDDSKTFTVYIESAPIIVSKLPIKSGMTGADVATIQTGITKLGSSGVVDLSTLDAMNNSLLKIAEIKTILY